ncbi:NirD/YgiW/YdeI family stress tolerance protein [Mailhella massiliensis]|uniref:NirD/YgiW/YdeI family stress tolerance protein n=1 Tax=Mailhella massiliensis TaxID=1903261 RepID=UPI0026EA9780|nr:NirD/YgiW/YdeI family stress tolerance protein [Mailhella massiliensis]
MTMYPLADNSRPFPAARPSRRRAAVPAALAASLALLLTLGASDALANRGDGGYTQNNAYSAAGGYTGPGPSVSTVEQAKKMRDDTHVTLRGRIVQHLGGDHYLFKDETGAINVDIDHKRWQGQTVGPDDLVEIHGEVDKDWNELEIDVDRLIKR